MSREIDEIEAAALSIQVLRLLDGLSVGQAKWVLDLTQLHLGMATQVDVSHPNFIAVAQEFEAVSRG